MAGKDAGAVIFGRNIMLLNAVWLAGNAMPADTVAWGAITTPYADLGYTSGGIQLNTNITRGTIDVDQEFDPLYRPITGRGVNIQTNLSQSTPQILNLASGLGTTTTLAPVTGVRGHDDLNITSGVVEQYNTYVADIQQVNGEAFRLALWKCIASGSPAPQYQPTPQANVVLQASALPDTSVNPARIAQIRRVLPAA